MYMYLENRSGCIYTVHVAHFLLHVNCQGYPVFLNFAELFEQDIDQERKDLNEFIIKTMCYSR